MGFFATFAIWLNGILAGYIGTNTARIATLIAPTFLTLAILYVMVWGWLQLTGRIDDPFIAGIKRIILLVVVLGGGLDLWLYNTVIVDTFLIAPTQLAAGILGAFDPVGLVDQIIFTGGDAATLLIQKGGLFGNNFSYYLAGFSIYLIVGLVAVYTMFLLTLSRIALSVLLAIGPLFIALLLFETTKRFFEAWVAQLSTYALITILTVLVAALMLQIVSTAAQQAASLGGGITIADAVRVCMAAGLTFLVMRQVMPMAASLGGGMALSTFGLVTAALAWGFGSTTRNGSLFLRGLAQRQMHSNSPLAHRAGAYLGQAGQAGVRRLAASWRENSIRPYTGDT
jgi:type IV secretion system protein VirB6